MSLSVRMVRHGCQQYMDRTSTPDWRKNAGKKRKTLFNSTAANARYLSLGTVLILAASKLSRRKYIFSLTPEYFKLTKKIWWVLQFSRNPWIWTKSYLHLRDLV